MVPRTVVRALAAWALVCALPTAAIALPLHKGDVNGDELVNVSDVNCMILATLANAQGDPDPVCQGFPDADVDMQCDGQVNVLDVQQLILVRLWALSSDPAIGALLAKHDPDMDGLHNGCDDDDDGDGFSDACEATNATDPLDPQSVPTAVNACTCPDQCDIGGLCVADGGAKAGDPCLRCVLASDPVGWSVADGAACDDGDPCTTGDTCAGDVCAGDPVVCPDDGDVCTVDVCAPGTGACGLPFVDGAPCDDGDLCTVGDACLAGVCEPGPATTCADDGDPCITDVCDPLTGACGVAAPNGTSCDDGDLCTLADSCVAGACAPGLPLSCADDGNPCTAGVCDPGTGACSDVPDDGTPCEDGDLCTSGDACLAGACLPGATATCSDDGNPCTVDVCDPLTGGCGVPAIEGKACDDGDPCTVLDECTQGLCGGADGVELCGNGVDDDCDVDIDEEPCDPIQPGVPWVAPEFATTLGTMSGLVEEIGVGKFASPVVGLGRPNRSGDVSGTMLGVPGGSAPLAVSAGPVASVELAVSALTVREDDATTLAFVLARDAEGRHAAAGTAITVSATGAASGSWGCTLDADGRCTATLTLPGASVGAGGSIAVKAAAGSVESAAVALTAIQSPAPLTLDPATAGAWLPLGPRYAGTSFQVPVRIHSAGQAIGSYDVELHFDPAILQVTGVAKGAAAPLGVPVHNAGAGANTTGVLSFNAINEAPGSPGASGDAVHVATVTFQVKAGAPAGATSPITGSLVDLYSTALTKLSSGTDLRLRDGAGPSTAGAVTVATVSLSGILAWAPEAQLVGLALPGSPASTDVVVLGVRSNGATVNLTGDPQTSCASTNPAILAADGCTAVAGAYGGDARVTVFHGAHQASVPLRVLALEHPVEVRFDDPVLQPIAGYGGTQGTRARAVATFRGGPASFSVDLGTLVTWHVAGTAVTVDPQSGIVTAAGPGTATVMARDFFGVTLGEATITVSTTPVTPTGLEVALPALVETLPVSPGTPVAAQAGTVHGRLRSAAFLDAEFATVQSHIFLILSDDAETKGGSRIPLPGNPALSFGTDDANVVTVDPATGLVTAVGTGLTNVTAALGDGAGGTITTGAGQISVALPAATGATVSPASSDLALTASDTAATHLGLPTSRQLTVTVHYVDGSSTDFTADPRTQWDATTLDPADLVDVSPSGVVSSTGNGTGTAKVRVTFDGFTIAAEATVQVVTHGGLTLAAWEPYTPSGARTAESLLSYIEGTTTRQTASLELIETFSNGATLNITTQAGTAWLVRDPATQAPKPGVLSITGGVASAIAAGTAELVATSAGHTSNAIPLSVEEGSVDLVALSPTVASGATFSGVKDAGTTQMSVWGTLSDGTHRQLTGSSLIGGLLAFASTDTAFATITASGLATIRGNGPTSLTVDVAAEAGAAFGDPVAVPVACNLTPTAGDIDLGDASGLAHKDRGPNELFDMPVRLHTGGQALGAFDLEVHYDPAVIEALGVTAGSGLGAGTTFSGNASTTPGVVFINGFAAPTGAQTIGSGVEIARIQFRAVKTGGVAVTAVGGTVLQVVALDGTTAIGPATPRAIVAGAGDLDPACPNDPVIGDANDDCTLAANDGLFVQQSLAGLVTPTPSQQARSDAFPDGSVNVNDAYYLSRVLARLTHFVSAEAVEVGGGQWDLVARVVDRDQQPVDDQIDVRFEVRSLQNPGLVLSAASMVTPDGVMAPGSPLGGGEWGISVSGLTAPEPAVGVVVILDVLDPLGAVVESVAFLGSRVTDPAAGVFTPLLTFEVPQADCGALDCDDGDPCTADSCTPQDGCVHAPLASGPCDDGDPCTTGDACSAAGCTGTPLTCAPTGDPCLLDVCDPASGLCGIPVADATPCDDGDGCTTGDACTGGFCAGSPYAACQDPAYGLVCVVTGTVGTEVECPVQLARTAEGDLPAAALQLTLSYDPRLLVDHFSDGVHPTFGFPWSIPTPFSSLQSGHSVSMQPSPLTSWVGSGTLLMANTADPTAPISEAWVDGGVVQGDATVILVHFVVDQEIPPGSPAEIRVLNVTAADKTSEGLVVETTDLLIQTSPKP